MTLKRKKALAEEKEKNRRKFQRMDPKLIDELNKMNGGDRETKAHD